jgi:protoporphyrinogen oxidase
VSDAPVVVLGAGCTGLYAGLAAARRGLPVLVLERDPQVGGLAASIHAGGHVFEKGPHIFHTVDRGLEEDVRTLAADVIQTCRRTIAIKYLGHLFRYPLSPAEVLRKLPLTTVARAGLSFAWQRLRSLVAPASDPNTETVLVHAYGRVLYEIFFADYIRKVWGIQPAEFSPAFARTRIPKLSVGELLGSLPLPRRRRVSGAAAQDYVEKVEGHLYTSRQGFGLIAEQLADAIRALGGDVRTGAEVVRLEVADGRVCSVAYRHQHATESVQCRSVISTIPLTTAIDLLEPTPPPPVTAAAAALEFRALVFVGLVVRRAPVLPTSLFYLRNQPFNRVSELGQLGYDPPLPGGTTVVAEMTCSPEDAIWTDSELARRLVIDGLVEEGLLAAAEVEAAHVYRERHAYPVYRVGFEEHLERVLGHLDGLANLHSTGRQGRFGYVNIHVAMKMGQKAADSLGTP